MDENKTSASTEDAPLSGRELLTAVRDVLRNNPERHNQETWIANRFAQETWIGSHFHRLAQQNLVEKLRKFARLPIPKEPADADEPVCGTTGCVAGWAAILGAPAGARITNGCIYLPGDVDKGITGYAGDVDKDIAGYAADIAGYAADLLGLREEEGDWMFSAYRNRWELIAALDAKLADPDADIPANDDEDW